MSLHHDVTPCLSFTEPTVRQLVEKEKREGTEKVYDERMDMIMEVSARTPYNRVR